jgi:hypothetical protein
MIWFKKYNNNLKFFILFIISFLYWIINIPILWLLPNPEFS